MDFHEMDVNFMKLVILLLFCLLRTIHNANEFQCFLGLRGSRICEFYDNSTIFGDFYGNYQKSGEFQENWWNSHFLLPGGAQNL